MSARGSVGLTPQQGACLDAIKRYSADHGGVMPSLNDLAGALGIKARTRVHDLLHELEERGRITRKPGVARAIQLIHRRCPHCEHEL